MKRIDLHSTNTSLRSFLSSSKINSKIKRFYIIINIVDFLSTLTLPRITFKGGQVAFFFFKHRFKRTFAIILSSCYLYLAHENDQEKIAIVNEIIQDIISARKVFEREQKGEGVNQLLAVLSLISGIVVPVILVPEILKKLSDVLDALGHVIPFLNFIIIILLYFVVPLALARYGLKYMLPQIRTYLGVVLFYQFQSKEMVVYSSLDRIQLFIIAHDPNISKLADESFFNFIQIIMVLLTRKKRQ